MNIEQVLGGLHARAAKAHETLPKVKLNKVKGKTGRPKS